MDSEWLQRLSTLLSDAVCLEHHAFYFYLAAGTHFDSRDIALLNLRDFFYTESNDELTHAKIVIKHMNQRGLSVVFKDISVPDVHRMSLQEIFSQAAQFEQKVLDHYLKIQKEADGAGDYETTQFIDFFVDKQIREVKEFHDKLVNATRCDSSLGEFIFDQSFKKSKK